MDTVPYTNTERSMHAKVIPDEVTEFQATGSGGSPNSATGNAMIASP